MKSVVLVRDPEKVVPRDFIDKLMSAHKAALGFAIPVPEQNMLFVKRYPGEFPADELDKLQANDLTKGRKLIVSAMDNPSPLLPEDQQPFTVLATEDGKPQLVAFLDGDFSGYTHEGQSFSPEFFCVQEDIAPRIQKIAKFMQGNLHALAKELEDPQYVKDFSNMMLGSRGSITLAFGTGQVMRFSVATDETQSEGDGWWSSNNLNVTPATKADNRTALEKDLEAAFTPFQSAARQSAEPHKTGKGPPPIPGTDGGKKPGHGLAGSKPKVAAIPEPVPGTGPQPAPAHTEPVGPSSPVTAPDYADPETVLPLKVPNFHGDMGKKVKWIQKVTSEEWVKKNLKSGVKGVDVLMLQRKEASAAYIQKFVEQNKLSGLPAIKSALKGSTAVVAPVAEAPKATSVPATAKKGPPPIPGEKGYPTRAGEPEHKPAPVPAQPEPAKPPVVEPGRTGDAPPAVTTEPMPILSPDQAANLIKFSESEKAVQIRDRSGQLIADPRGVDKVEKDVESFAHQLGGKLNIMDIAKWPMQLHLDHNKEDPVTGAHIRFWLAHELKKAYMMLDQLTEPHVPKQNTTKEEAIAHSGPQPAKRKGPPPIPGSVKAA